MGRKSVAVLDVRSSDLTVFVGERGVNNTFVFKASKTEPYYGYEDGKFYDEAGLSDAIFRAISAVEKICGEHLREIFVGVPGEFVQVYPQLQEISFPKRRTLSQRDIDALYESGKQEYEGLRFIRAASTVYTTADNRRVVNPIGLSSTSLSGILSYFYCTEYFASTLENVFSGSGISLHFLPTQLAMALLLVSSETRDEYALFLDAGYLSSSVLVIHGNGVLVQNTYWVGKAGIVTRLMQRFDLPFGAAEALLRRANLYVKRNAGAFEFIHAGISYDIDSDALVETVKEGLDEICESVGSFLEECTGRDFDYKPLYVTGEGLADIRGALEHVSKRVNRVCEEVAPALPYYNKPAMSSRVALAEMAYEDHRKDGFFYKLFNGFGG